MKERKKRSHSGEDRHHLVQFEFENEKRGDLFQLSVFQDNRCVLDREDCQIAGNAKRDP